MTYLAHLKGIQDAARIRACLDALSLGPLAATPLAQLSGGQLRRVGLAQALLGSPLMLLLDELLRGLDVQERERVVRLTRQLAASRLVIFSSHVPGEVEQMASKMIVLREGKVAYIGGVHALRRQVRGQVHEIRVRADAVAALAERFTVSRIIQDNGEEQSCVWWARRRQVTLRPLLSHRLKMLICCSKSGGQTFCRSTGCLALSDRRSAPA